MIFKLMPVVIPAAVLMLACSSADVKESGDGAGSQTSNIPGIEIGLLNETAFSRILEENRGKVLLVNVWATWCVPCREEFSDLVRLAEFYRGEPVAVIGVSADYPDELESKVRPFLLKMKADFPNFIQNFAKDEQFINFMNRNWQGDLPATFIYDESGEQVAFLSARQTYESFRTAIDKVLKTE